MMYPTQWDRYLQHGALIIAGVQRPGQGRSGGFRTLLVYRARTRSVFVYGFPKSERDNIDPDELVFWRKVAAAYLAMNGDKLAASIASDEITEVTWDAEGEDEDEDE